MRPPPGRRRPAGRSRRPGRPRTAATTGFGQRATLRRIAGSSRTPSSPGAAAASSFRFIPEQNTGPRWSSTTTRTPGSAVATSSAALSPVRTAADSALRVSGESRVIVATPPATSSRTGAGCCTRHSRHRCLRIGSDWTGAIHPARRRTGPGRRVAAGPGVRREWPDRDAVDLPARAVLRDPVRLLRFQHLHRRRAGLGGVPAVLARRRARRDRPGRKGSRCSRGQPCRSARSSSAAARRRWSGPAR